MRNRCIVVFLTTVFIRPADAQDKSWVGDPILLKKSGVYLRKIEKQGDTAKPAPLFNAGYEVLGDDAGQIQINDGRGHVGWLDKADAVILGDAVAFFTERLRKNPLDVEDYYRRGLARLLRKEHDTAIKDFDESIRLNPSADAYRCRGFAWYEKKCFDKAITDYNNAIRLNPADKDYLNRGIVWAEKRDFDKAFTDFNEAIRLNPKDAQTFYNRGLAHAKKGDFEQALIDFDQAIRIDPKCAPAYCDRGNVYGIKGDSDRAMADYNEAIRVDPKYAAAYHNRAVTWFERKDHKKAIADLSEVIRLHPDWAGEYHSRGDVWRDQKAYEKAIADYAEAFRLDPSRANACDTIAWLLATCPDAKIRDGKRAFWFAKKAMALEPTNADYMDSLAAAYAEIGDFAEAVRWQERVLEDSSFRGDENARRRLDLYKRKQPYRED